VHESCEHGNKSSGFVKGSKFIDQLNDYQLLKNVFCSTKVVREIIYSRC
jgi:hypothetical protein